jgi:pre-mRNA-splicing factor CDC5/CEF1
MSSNKDRLDSLEKNFQTNRQNMTKQAKRAAKLEKRLKLLTGGYQSRATVLSKQLSDVHDQCEQSSVEMNTFKVLQEMESFAIPRRLEVCVSVAMFYLCSLRYICESNGLGNIVGWAHG